MNFVGQSVRRSAILSGPLREPSTGGSWWRGYLLVAGWPLLITLLSIVSSPTGTGPFDARTAEQLVGFQLTMPTWEAFFEPFLAIFYVIADAADYRSTAISMMVWLFLLSFSGQLFFSQDHTLARRVRRSITFATGACLLLLLYFFFAAL